MISFQYPWFFTGIAAVILLAIFMGLRKRPAVTVSSVSAVKKTGGQRRFRLTIPEISLLLALTVLFAALARPRKPATSGIIRPPGVDIILALDMSQSMSCYDRPEGVSERKFFENISSNTVGNRLENAKAEIRTFIEARPNDRIGLIGFADLAYSFVPPTLDHALLLERLKDLNPGDLGNATGIASPIGSGAQRLKNAPSPRRVLVLFTDGANTAANRLSPQNAAKAAAKFNVIIHTVGVGSPNSYAIQYNRILPVQSDLDVKLLKEIAAITGGKYFAAADAAGMKQVMADINALERTDPTAPQVASYHEYAPLLALIAAGIFTLGVMLTAVVKVRLP